MVELLPSSVDEDKLFVNRSVPDQFLVFIVIIEKLVNFGSLINFSTLSSLTVRDHVARQTPRLR